MHRKRISAAAATWISGVTLALVVVGLAYLVKLINEVII